MLKTARYARDGLISVHVSKADPGLYKLLHPQRSKSDLDSILQAVKNLIGLGYPTDQLLNSVTFTGLQKNIAII
ncbi:hypothetical protein GF407_16600 [candidate division KSB1 bacterium]|nr:hypothetical protein [candidate division KSB1 bacterium]